MNEMTLRRLTRWFDDYAGRYYVGDEGLDYGIELKHAHSRRVRNASGVVARRLNMTVEDVFLAEAIGLFHDVGRFEQFKRYGTYHDNRSVNHAELGVAVLKEEKTLDVLPPLERELFLSAVDWHNRLVIPDDQPERTRRFACLLRDADKIDIFRVVVEYYRERDAGGMRRSTIELEMPDEPGYTEEVFEDVWNRRRVNSESIKCLNDFKLLQIGWLYVLNFDASFEVVKSEGYLRGIFDFLPDTDSIRRLKERVDEDMKAERRFFQSTVS